MSDATTRPRRGFTAAGGIKLILALQLGIAAILFGGDLARILPRLAAPSTAPEMTQPVFPGDQTRRFDRRHVPTRPAQPGMDVPATGDMPSRLLFEAEGEILGLTGAIAQGDAQRLADWRAGRPTPATVELHSTGGSVSDALAIGRSLRADGVATEITEGAVCLSACPYMLASGTDRRVHRDGYVGVHQHYFGENTVLPAFLAVEDIQRGQGEVMAYLEDMEIDLRLMKHALQTPPEAIYILVPQELTDYRLATEITD